MKRCFFFSALEIMKIAFNSSLLFFKCCLSQLAVAFQSLLLVENSGTSLVSMCVKQTFESFLFESGLGAEWIG